MPMSSQLIGVLDRLIQGDHTACDEYDQYRCAEHGFSVGELFSYLAKQVSLNKAHPEFLLSLSLFPMDWSKFPFLQHRICVAAKNGNLGALALVIQNRWDEKDRELAEFIHDTLAKMAHYEKHTALPAYVVSEYYRCILDDLDEAQAFYKLSIDNQRQNAQNSLNVYFFSDYKIVFTVLNQLKYHTQHTQLLIESLKISANNGHPDAQYILAYCYFTGLGVEYNLSKALKLLAHLAERGHVDARYQLVCCSLVADADPMDREKAMSMLYNLAKEGHIEAFYQLIDEYIQHGRCDHDTASSIEKGLFELSMMDDDTAQCMFAWAYIHGLVTEHCLYAYHESNNQAYTLPNALYILEKLAFHQNHSLSQTKLGMLKLKGKSCDIGTIAIDKTMAIHCFQLAANNGNMSIHDILYKQMETCIRKAINSNDIYVYGFFWLESIYFACKNNERPLSLHKYKLFIVQLLFSNPELRLLNAIKTVDQFTKSIFILFNKLARTIEDSAPDKIELSIQYKDIVDRLKYYLQEFGEHHLLSLINWISGIVSLPKQQCYKKIVDTIIAAMVFMDASVRKKIELYKMQRSCDKLIEQVSTLREGIAQLSQGENGMASDCIQTSVSRVCNSAGSLKSQWHALSHTGALQEKQKERARKRGADQELSRQQQKRSRRQPTAQRPQVQRQQSTSFATAHSALTEISALGAQAGVPASVPQVDVLAAIPQTDVPAAISQADVYAVVPQANVATAINQVDACTPGAPTDVCALSVQAGFCIVPEVPSHDSTVAQTLHEQSTQDSTAVQTLHEQSTYEGTA